MPTPAQKLRRAQSLTMPEDDLRARLQFRQAAAPASPPPPPAPLPASSADQAILAAISPPAVSQAANRRTASWRMRAVPGEDPPSSRPAIQEFSAARLIGRWSASAHQLR